jgi:uncharacterized protein
MRRWTALLALAAIVGLTAPARAITAADRPTISVNGEASVNVVPDRIVVRFGIETSDMDMQLAKRKNNGILKAALVAVRALGVADRDLQTDFLQVEPRYQEYGNREFLGYFVRVSFVVTLRDPAKVEELTSAALAAGVTHVHGIDYQTSAYKEHRTRARELALKAAQEKATLMAAALGRGIGPALQIGEGYGGGWWYNSGWSYGRGGQMSQNVVQEAGPPAGAESTDTFALGTISIRASVTVTFELK